MDDDVKLPEDEETTEGDGLGDELDVDEMDIADEDLEDAGLGEEE